MEETKILLSASYSNWHVNVAEHSPVVNSPVGKANLVPWYSSTLLVKLRHYQFNAYGYTHDANWDV